MPDTAAPMGEHTLVLTLYSAPGGASYAIPLDPSLAENPYALHKAFSRLPASFKQALREADLGATGFVSMALTLFRHARRQMGAFDLPLEYRASAELGLGVEPGTRVPPVRITFVQHPVGDSAGVGERMYNPNPFI